MVVAEPLAKAVALALALGGCQVLFPLEDPPPIECPSTLIHDEDGDTVDDSCDNCPTIANLDQADTFEDTPDGVGDVCDPSTAADRIVLFQSFAEAEAAARWRDPELQWSVAGDNLVYTGSNDFHTVFDTEGTMLEPPFTAVFHATLDSLFDDFVALRIAVHADPDGNMLICGLERRGTTEDIAFIEAVGQVDTSSDSADQTDFSVGGGYTVTLSQNTATQAGCSIVPDLEDEPPVSASLDFMPIGPGRLGFEVFDLKNHIAYLIVYGPQ